MKILWVIFLIELEKNPCLRTSTWLASRSSLSLAFQLLFSFLAYMYGRILSKLRGNKAEAQIVVATRRVVVVATRRATNLRIEVPATATIHATRPRTRTHWICLTISTVIWFIPITTPFPNIPMHVIQAPCISRITSNGLCFPQAIIIIRLFGS